MQIGRVAERSGVPAKTIRYYEDIGLISKPDRTTSGYRAYASQDVEILRFVSRARGLGFSIKDVRNLLALFEDRERASADVKKIALDHVDEIDRKIKRAAAPLPRQTGTVPIFTYYRGKPFIRNHDNG